MSVIEDTIEEIDSLVQENVKAISLLTQTIQNIWNTIKRINLRIIGIEVEVYQLQGTENIFNKIMEENFPSLKKDICIKKFTVHKKGWTKTIIIKTLNVQKKTAKEKGQITYKGRLIRIIPYFSMENLKSKSS